MEGTIHTDTNTRACAFVCLCPFSRSLLLAVWVGALLCPCIFLLFAVPKNSLVFYHQRQGSFSIEIRTDKCEPRIIVF